VDAPKAAALTRKPRRSSDDDVGDMAISPCWTRELVGGSTLTPGSRELPVMRCEMLLAIAGRAIFLSKTLKLNGKLPDLDRIGVATSVAAVPREHPT
jgi:hypothetical protein